MSLLPRGRPSIQEAGYGARHRADEFVQQAPERQWCGSISGAIVLGIACRFVCDELDGRFARMLNQATMLGQVLDMVTDRCNRTSTPYQYEKL